MQLCLLFTPFFTLKTNFMFRRNCLCGLVVRVPGYRSRDPGSIPELPDFLSSGSGTGPLSLAITIEELLARKRSCSGVETRDYGRWDPPR
jgi:hypothetical protein